MGGCVMPTVHARPYDCRPFDPAHTALVMIDMQRDFVEPGGFGAMLGNDVSLLRPSCRPACACSRLARAKGMAGDAHPRGARCPTWPTARRPSARAATRRCASATPARWAACWWPASRATTSCPSCCRSPANRASTSRARAPSTPRPARDPACAGHHAPAGVHRRHHRGLRADHDARSQRPRLRVPARRGLHRELLPAVQRRHGRDDGGAGRHRRLGRA
jgi:hypothetical protein